jgi:hypothetical protein
MGAGRRIAESGGVEVEVFGYPHLELQPKENRMDANRGARQRGESAAAHNRNRYNLN